MQIDIRARGIELSERLRTHAERQVRLALGSTGSRVRFVVVRLADEDETRSGLAKRCTIRATLPGAPPVVVEQHEADIWVAIDRATDRVGRAVSRRLDRISG